MNEYFLKLQAIGELEEIAKMAKANREATEIMLSILGWLNRFCDENHIKAPDEDLIIDQMKKLQTLLGESPDLQRPLKSPRDSTEPT